MPETHEVQSVLDAGQQAAAAGDYASAEKLLREAVRLQEADLGPLHPDLANTLNNLGVVCEITDKPADAELFYRKAYAIATAVLKSDHPFVATSRKNLTDFCEARGKPVESPLLAAEAADKPQEAPAQATEPRPQDVIAIQPPLADALPDPLPSEPLPPQFTWASRSFAIGALAACGVMVLLAIAVGAWLFSSGPAESSLGSVEDSLHGNSSSAPGPVPGQPRSGTKETTAGRGRTALSKPRTAAIAAPPLTVTDAGVCTDLSRSGLDWECKRPSAPIIGGPVFFYTRLKSASDATVEHRWYRGGELRRVVTLRIRANPTAGYRTYSRTTLDNRSTGNWRVELRTEDGSVLREERFAVR